MKVLLVDGPEAGKLTTADGPEIHLPEPGGPVVYYVHFFWASGARIMLGSVHDNTDNVSPGDVANVILSDKAKEAMVQE